jgi:hypothetical protein
MRVDEPWEHDEARAVDHTCAAVVGQTGSDCDDHVVVDEHVATLDLGAGIVERRDEVAAA